MEDAPSQLLPPAHNMAAITTGVSFDTASVVFEPPHKQCTGNEARQIVAEIDARTPTLEQSMADIKATMDLMSNTPEPAMLTQSIDAARSVPDRTQWGVGRAPALPMKLFPTRIGRIPSNATRSAS